ncbi:MAG TPA: glycosyltransferase family 39 protein [Pyrinomonadaceae bacterium]|nr:glycosyltransferase family 39 protein [Pyrinomonadaceae bacterium]
MNAVLTVFSLLIVAFIVLAVPTIVAPHSAEYGMIFTTFDSAKAVLLSGALASFAGWVFYRQKNGSFLLKIFVAAVLVRVLLGAIIFMFNGRDFFGADAIHYDFYGGAQLAAWNGDRYYTSLMGIYTGGGLAGAWGMVYLVAAIYGLIGHNPLAVQMVVAVMGAATAPVIYLCAAHVFQNLRVARFSAFAVAFYPSLVLWSSQGLKDGPIVLFLAVAILTTLRLGEKFSVKYVAILVAALFLVLTFRFYVFYMIFAAVAGALVIGMQKVTATSFARQFAIVILIGLALTYMGVTRYANVHLSFYTRLERVQASRADAATNAQSGYGQGMDVSTGEGAIKTIPLGLVYLLFAPFPWQLTSLRQSITLPEMVVWWASFPLLILGLWFSIKYRLRAISPVLMFTVMLTLAYSIFQGNVGNAYRQRSQLLVFYFIFVGVGYVLLLERREERKRRDLAEPERLPVRVAASEVSHR